MIFKNIYPSAPLQQLVQFYRLRHFIIQPTIKVYPKPFPAQPEHCIAFYPRGFEITEIHAENIKIAKPRSVLSGQYTQRVNRYSGSLEFLMIQIVFQPGSLHRITGIPFNELVNTHIDLENIFAKEAKQTNEELANCNSYNEMIAVIEKFLHSLLQKQKLTSRPSDEVLHLLAFNPEKYSLQWLSGQACLSPRQFERKTNEYLGVPPQLFTRIARFNNTYLMRLQYPHKDWLSIAVHCGYHDYQHLVRDYKQFAGTTPNQLFNDESKVLERALGLNS